MFGHIVVDAVAHTQTAHTAAVEAAGARSPVARCIPASLSAATTMRAPKPQPMSLSLSLSRLAYSWKQELEIFFLPSHPPSFVWRSGCFWAHAVALEPDVLRH